MSPVASGVTVRHRPVMVDEVVEFLAAASPVTVLDGTVGLGGHAERILSLIPSVERYVGLDWDDRALGRARETLAPFGDRVTLVRSSFEEGAGVASDLGLRPDAVLLDLGTSMLQLKDPSRGFSFSASGPLDMRMDDRRDMTAAEFLRTAGTERVRQVLERYGEVRFAGRLARVLTEGPETPTDTAAVVRAVERALPTPFLKTRRRHPATAVFQALRIAVNDELGALERALPRLFDRLAPGGLFLVISFHSLEDRLVKTFFKDQEGACTCPRDLPRCVCHRRPRVELLTRKPLAASERETAENPPSRSAKLRVARKLS